MSEINRRGFLGMMIGGVAATAAVRTFPFRVFSFPTNITIVTPYDISAIERILVPDVEAAWGKALLIGDQAYYGRRTAIGHRIISRPEEMAIFDQPEKLKSVDLVTYEILFGKDGFRF